MLSTAIFAILLFSASSRVYGSEFDKPCILPPYPKHGTYKLLDPQNLTNFTPGDELPSYVLEVICKEGYIQSYNDTQVCLGGLKSSEEPPQCLPPCIPVSHRVLSCGFLDNAEEVLCMAPQNVASVSSARISVNEKLECGTTGPVYAQVIAGGRVATAAELPWHAGIYTKTTRPYMQICGGTLVSLTAVVSAAHCFWSDIEKKMPASKYAVAVGKIYRPWNDSNDQHVQKSDVSQVTIPPRFQGGTTSFQDDLALVILTTAVEVTPYVRPVCIDFDLEFEENQLKPGNMGKVGGWGLTSEDGKASPILKVVEMPIVGIEQCISHSDPTFIRHITSDKICAGYNNGTSVCKGDSGGGLTFPALLDGVERHFLRGVVSTAPRSDHLCNTLTWATFTRVQNHQGFLRGVVPVSPSSSSADAVISLLPAA